MVCGEWIERLNRLAPERYACAWDNPGLIAGRKDKEIRKVLIALDAVDEAVDRAAEEGADLILTHHPLIFSPMKKINDQDFIGRRLLKLIGHDICCYAMHTNFDAAPGCMADIAAEALGILDGRPLEIMGQTEDGIEYGIGKCGTLAAPVTLKELAGRVKREFTLPFVTVYGADHITGPVERAAVCPGSGKGMTQAAVEAGAQVLITGDMGHHDGIDAAAQGLAVIDAGHYGLEHVFVDVMADYCAEHIDPGAVIVTMPLKFPVVSW